MIQLFEDLIGLVNEKSRQIKKQAAKIQNIYDRLFSLEVQMGNMVLEDQVQ